MKRLLSLVTLFVLLGLSVSAQQVLKDQTNLTTPGAPWTLVIDGRPLTIKESKVKPDEKSAYFLFERDTVGLNISFFIEPVDKCTTSRGCRDYVLGLGNPKWGKYQDLAKGDIGDFSHFEFYRPEAMSLPLKMFDMYAEYVADGYWIDLHISKTDYKKEDHALFENLVRAIKFVPKTAKTAGAPLPHPAAETWLAAWDAGKCKESFAALSALSREGIDEEQWNGYCSNAQNALGKMRTRKVLAGTLTKSLSAKPEYGGATIRYQSSFEKFTPVVEVITLVMEKNGTWSVANYLVQ